jgi:hypothetical protein
MVKGVLIVAVAIVVGGFLAGGRYTSSSQQNYTYISDRFTGSTWTCFQRTCYKVEFQNSD